MKTTIIAAIAVLSLGGVSAAYAQGAPVGFEPPAYGSQAFSDHRNEPVVHFLGKGTVLGKLFNHSDREQPVADRSSPAVAAHG